MSAYRVRHRTSYHYHSAVAYSRLMAHLVPRTTERQRSLAVDLAVSPVPSGRFERADYFGNTTSNFVIDEPHDALEIVAESRVSVEPIPAYVADESPAWEAVRASFEPPLGPGTFDVLQYTFDTPLTATDDEVVAYARTSFPRERALFACVLELNGRIHRDFAFDKEATDTRTTVQDA